jgi:predicted dehydrogenase
MQMTLGFAIVGTGRMGMRRLASIVDHPRATVVTVADSDMAAATEAAERADCALAADHREAVADPAVDCVVVATPNKLHRPVVLDALAHGKHVFCEKPLAGLPSEAVEMVQAAARHGTFLKVGSNLRHFPSVQKARELLDENAIGETLFLRGWIGNNGWSLASWWSDPAEVGGGTFLDNGCHLLDLSRWFLGEAWECTGWTGTLLHPVAPLEDNGVGIFRFEGHKLAVIQSSWTEWADYCYFELYGSEGYMRVDNRAPACTVTVGRRDGSQEVHDFRDVSPQSYALEMDDFIHAVIDGRQPLPSGFDGMRTVQMAHAIYEANRSGRSQSLRRSLELAPAPYAEVISR